jgi:hypothetical protein
MADTTLIPLRGDLSVDLLKKIVRLLGGTVDNGDTEQTLTFKWAALVLVS